MIWGNMLDTDSLQFGFKAVTACLLDCSKAFDKCRYDVLFEKLLSQGLPAIVVRALIFIYEEQAGWVKLAGKRSSEFQLTKGTR